MADKADICAPVMPEGILTLTKMEQLPPEGKIIARNISIFRQCRPALNSQVPSQLGLVSVSITDWIRFSHLRVHICHPQHSLLGKIPTSLLKFIPVG